VTTFTVAHHHDEGDGGFTPAELLRFGRRKSIIGVFGSHWQVVVQDFVDLRLPSWIKKRVEFANHALLDPPQ